MILTETGMVTAFSVLASFHMACQLYGFGHPEHGQLGDNTNGQYFVSANKLSYRWVTEPKHVAIFVEKVNQLFLRRLLFTVCFLGQTGTCSTNV